MKFEVDKEVLERTTKCEFNFECLTCDVKKMCQVIALVGDSDKIVYVHPGKNHQSCPYFTSFGKSYICSCPTRLGIYRRYEE